MSAKMFLPCLPVVTVSLVVSNKKRGVKVISDAMMMKMIHVPSL